HSWFQFQIRVAHSDDCVVGHNVLDGDWRVAHLDDLAVKSLHRKSVHCEIDVLIDFDDADIRFGDIRVDLHFGEIVCNREDDWRLQTGRDRLANINTARNHYSIDRRGDCAMVKIGFRFIERALFDLHVRLRLMKIWPSLDQHQPAMKSSSQTIPACASRSLCRVRARPAHWPDPPPLASPSPE